MQVDHNLPARRRERTNSWPVDRDGQGILVNEEQRVFSRSHIVVAVESRGCDVHHATSCRVSRQVYGDIECRSSHCTRKHRIHRGVVSAREHDRQALQTEVVGSSHTEFQTSRDIESVAGTLDDRDGRRHAVVLEPRLELPLSATRR